MDVEPDVRPASDEQVGIDVGLKTFAYLSDGSHLENPRFFRAEEQALAKAQRKLAKAKGNRPETRKRRKVVARIHERISNRRQNFIGQQVALLVKRFGLIAVEALVVRNMVKNPKLAKSIADAAWSAFFTQLVLKAEEAARQRVYECGTCALMLDRDHNASRNILQQAVGRHGRVTPEALGF
jgi:putative transposase